ncbi:hypothetical protein LPTSP3_g09870 [Leptospira kobayashii]|uniref:Uncharacterized protein n=1 Tax=Leptospira kobayashii TaxID=1917830 RepID=A0ABM7UHE9_9LEPT|nr:hypothetical protein [Leptospira kobayashii]BDA78057.1 hypothetical protein LPTSP3_g09870 [Leptospira kobayashii]
MIKTSGDLKFGFSGKNKNKQKEMTKKSWLKETEIAQEMIDRDRKRR